MVNRIATVIKRLQDPRYTGSRRCLPCTVLNVTLLLGVAASALLVHRWLSVALFVLGAAMIVLRGYLIPGTPELTQKFLPDVLRTRFGHVDEHPEMTSDGKDVIALLQEFEVVEECDELDDLCLNDTFRSEWKNRLDELDGMVDTAQFSSALGIDRELVSMENGILFVKRMEGRRDQWASAAAVVADVGSAKPLRDRLPIWDELSIDDRLAVLESLRVFLDDCPVCDGSLTVNQRETTIGCCQPAQTSVMECELCEDVLFRASQFPD